MMTLREISGQYRQSAQLLRQRLRILRQQEKAASDPDEKNRIGWQARRMAEMLTQMNELAELTAHYYEKEYRIHAKYRI